MRFLPSAVSVFLAIGFLAPNAVAAPAFHVAPSRVLLKGDYERAQLVVSATGKDGKPIDTSADHTESATYSSSNAKVATVDRHGVILARGNGKSIVTVAVGKSRREIPVEVTGIGQQPRVSFTHHIRPILAKQGCAAAACHASQFGKGGFKLSVFGFDPLADYHEIARASRQRRLNLARPEASLILQKPTMTVSHGGGRRLEVGTVEYDAMRSWIAAGASAPEKKTSEIVKLYVYPKRRVTQRSRSQQLRVVAEMSDGYQRDVTAFAKFDAMDTGVISVANDGTVTGVGDGQSAVMVRFDGHAEISMFVIPFSDNVALKGWKNNNFVDELAANKFRELRLEPSQLCDDATFMRRAYLDAIGTLPTAEAIERFLADKKPQKRSHLVDQLLGLTGDPKLDIFNDQYAATWTLKWSDLIRNNSNSLGQQGMWALHNWIRESFRTNKPFDQFVRELVTAKGSIYSNGPANYFRINSNSTALTESTAQLFLGIRLECAKCHHHPFEKYSQADYYGLAAFFSRIGTKTSEEFGLFGREQVVVVRSSGEVAHPKTRKRMTPTTLDGQEFEDKLDRRLPLASWLTAPDNDFFAKSVVNRYVGYLMGRGLVEPIDDMRSTNPPSNVALMDALAKDFVAHKYDLKHLMRTIMTSRLYQLSSQPTKDNAADRRFYSHYTVKRLKAEPLLDAIDYVTNQPTKFQSLPLGTRAIELPDAEYPNYFLKTFAKPRRASVCECERSPYENLAQALHTLNGDTLAKKIAGKGSFLSTMLSQKLPHERMVSDIYLRVLCRKPTAAEMDASREFLTLSASPAEYYQDLMWALINSKQFLFVY